VLAGCPRKGTAMREKGWYRGELVIRGTEIGFVKNDMDDLDEFLVIEWQSGIERIHRSGSTGIRRLTEAETNGLKGAGLSPLKSLEALESVERVHAMSVERSRTIRSQGEQRIVDELIRRGFSEEFECDWDRKNADLLIVLALNPDQVGWLFKLRERIHRPIHAIFHHR
jgi:hypothetical protein